METSCSSTNELILELVAHHGDLDEQDLCQLSLTSKRISRSVQFELSKRKTLKFTGIRYYSYALDYHNYEPTGRFGSEFSASVNRSGDYVLNTFLRVQVPSPIMQKLTLKQSRMVG